MKNKFDTLKMLFIVMLYSFNAQAQGDPFNCDFNAYLFQYNDVYALDLASGNSYRVAEDVTPGNINAAAYNPVDGFIWGSLSTPEKSIVRIGKDFSTTEYFIDDLPSGGMYVGDVNSEGIYYLKSGGVTFHQIDLDPTFPDYELSLTTHKLSQNISIHDWAFNAVDNQLYAVEKGTNILYRIDPSDGIVSALGVVPILPELNYTYGAVYFDSEGRFYVSANQTGTIYMIQSVQDIVSEEDIESNFFAFGPSSSSNDGARCPTAPVQQEICDNGLDDDGDGLIDCEDPSCSGYGVCDVIETPTSSSNSGGLESNSRLSELISERNFKRTKSGYKFNIDKAKRLTKNSNYASSTTHSSGLALQDFVPLNSINEDEAIEASPRDLLSITNATDIFSVDYLKNNVAVASVLAIKTEDGVYEHTKYICDRLLGAELISVSTMTINDQEFIKSIIKNKDGANEFVLSFSAKTANADANFAVESHWNLDQYEENVTFYNFQIWSNTIDDLYALGQEVLNLLDVKKPISTYSNSKPPTVFVRKGTYSNGALEMQIINTNATDSVIFDAGCRTTETSEFDNLNKVITLNGNYITNLKIDTDQLFDIGFRIGDGMATPDDLFMSDGPWGIDDSDSSTQLSHYKVVPSNIEFDETEYAIERNIELTATTSNYVAAYRALTPRYESVDLSAYNTLKFQAQGTGILEVTVLKESITNWDDQFKAYVDLSDNFADVQLSQSDFSSSMGSSLVLDDVVTLVFTMFSETGELMTKSMFLSDLRFSSEAALSTFGHEEIEYVLTAYPNPMDGMATIQFEVSQSENVNIVLYDQLGRPIYQESMNAVSGINQFEFQRQDLISGIYIVKILSRNSALGSLKLIIR